MPANSQEPNTSLELQEWLSISEAGRNSPGHGCISPSVSKITLQFRRRKEGTLSTDESKHEVVFAASFEQSGGSERRQRADRRYSIAALLRRARPDQRADPV